MIDSPGAGAHREKPRQEDRAPVTEAHEARQAQRRRRELLPGGDFEPVPRVITPG
jgi:hypothetical protein